jgi:photoactive yellow protein
MNKPAVVPLPAAKILAEQESDFTAESSPPPGKVSTSIPVGSSEPETSRPMVRHDARSAAMINFDSPDALAWLEAASAQELDKLTFGAIRMTPGGLVAAYNTWESDHAGMTKERVLQRSFFADVAPCMNNYLVAERFRAEPDLDVVLDYIFTLRMRPTPVRLRLLKSSEVQHMYLLVSR